MLEISMLFRACYQVFFVISESTFRRLVLQIRGFHKAGIAKHIFSQKTFCIDFGLDFHGFFKSLGTCFSGFLCLGNKLEN